MCKSCWKALWPRSNAGRDVFLANTLLRGLPFALYTARCFLLVPRTHKNLIMCASAVKSHNKRNTERVLPPKRATRYFFSRWNIISGLRSLVFLQTKNSFRDRRFSHFARRPVPRGKFLLWLICSALRKKSCSFFAATSSSTLVASSTLEIVAWRCRGFILGISAFRTLDFATEVLGPFIAPKLC